MKKNYLLRGSIALAALSLFLMRPVQARWLIRGDCSGSVKDGRTNEKVAYLNDESNGFTTIEAALAAATNAGGGKVVVIPGDEARVITKNCVITNGVELVLPYYTSDKDHTLVTWFNDGGDSHKFDTGGLDNNNHQSPLFCDSKMILADNVSRTIQSGGILNINGRVGGVMGGYATGHTFMRYAEFQRSTGSHLEVESGGTLYSWGYIREVVKSGSSYEYYSGNGSNSSSIHIKGGKVYEPFVIYDWRGGKASVSIAVGNNPGGTAQTLEDALKFAAKTREIFPMHQFDCPNISPIMNLTDKGALYGRLSLYVDNKVTTEVKPILASENGLLNYSRGTLSWKFNFNDSNPSSPSYTSLGSHKTSIQFNQSKGTVGSLAVTLKFTLVDDEDPNEDPIDVDADIKTSDFFLPIGKQFDIRLIDSDFEVSNKIMFLPDSSLTIDSSSTCDVTSSFAAFYSPDDNNTSSGDANIVNNGTRKFKCTKSWSWFRYSYSLFGGKISGSGSISYYGDESYTDNHHASLKSNWSGEVKEYKFHIQKV